MPAPPGPPAGSAARAVPRPAFALAACADLADLLGRDARLFAFARRAAIVLVPLTLALVVALFGTGPEPRRNWYGDMMGNDLSQVWTVGRAALEGRAAQAYDLPRHLANLAAAFGPDCRFAWHYPPVFLLPAALLATLDPQAAYLAWSMLSVALFAGAMRLASGRAGATLVALAHPLVFCNLSYGQNGLVTAGLMTLGACLVDRRPWLAGLCFGCLAYKPQFAALAPLLLLASGRWGCLAACLATALAACLASLLLFGAGPWLGFLATLGQTGRITLTDAAAGLDFNASAYGAVRLAGGPAAAAWALQAAVAAGALALALRAWTRPTPPELRAAALLAAAPLLSPYVPVYDLAPLVPATLLLALAAHRAGGLRPHERALLVAAPLAALLRVGAGATGFSFGLALSLATLACVAARLRPRSRGAALAPAAA